MSVLDRSRFLIQRNGVGFLSQIYTRKRLTIACLIRSLSFFLSLTLPVSMVVVASCNGLQGPYIGARSRLVRLTASVVASASASSVFQRPCLLGERFSLRLPSSSVSVRVRVRHTRSDRRRIVIFRVRHFPSPVSSPVVPPGKRDKGEEHLCSDRPEEARDSPGESSFRGRSFNSRVVSIGQLVEEERMRRS